MTACVNLSYRVKSIIMRQEPRDDAAGQTLDLLRSILEPDSGRYDMLYRYEHSLRVASIGKRIAEQEHMPETPMFIACLLHDAGYPECRSMEDLKRHPLISAEIARLYLDRIGFDKSMSKSIYNAILIHDKYELLPEATSFELSVRDADDIDRFDAMRMCTWGYHDIGERPAKEIIDICHDRLRRAESSRERICGTDTARKMWLEKIDMCVDFYRRLLRQMQTTFDFENMGSNIL